MSHSLHTFRAATAEDALAQVRRELGKDAVVVEVNQVSSGGMFAWLSSRQQFEIKARRPSTAKRAKRSSTSRPLSTVPSNTGTIAAAASRSVKSAEVNQFKPATNSQASKDLPRVSPTVSPSPPSATKWSTDVDEPLPVKPHRFNTPEMPPPPPLLPDVSAPRNRIAELCTKGGPDLVPRGDAAVLGLPPSLVPPSGTESWRNVAVEVVRGMSAPADSLEADRNTAQSIGQRLDALQQMIADLGRRSQSRGLIEIPPELFPHYLTLVEADVEDEVARELIQSLHRHAAPDQLAETAATMALLTALVEQRIPCARSLSVQHSKRFDRGANSNIPTTGQRQIAMVVGPTGVGKTTTLAKLAGHFGVHEQCRLGLITVDTYRVAAVEQLRTYAEIIDLPMRIVANAAEMQEALDAFANCDLVLIDTAGRSPQDDRKLAELKQLIDTARPDHVYLVLSLASGPNALRAAAERFAAIRPTSLVITKLDEATGCGGLLSVARDIGLPISYFTTGQEVPRDLEPANPCRAARLIVGTATLTRSLVRESKSMSPPNRRRHR